MLEFDQSTEAYKFYNPSEEKEQEIEVEMRRDPLTGKTSRILEKPLPIDPDPDISDVDDYDFCPFCSEYIEDVGARDMPVLSKGKMEEGEAVLLANVTPYTKHSLVIRLTEEHYLPLDEFEPHYFADAFELIQKYLSRVEGSREKNIPTVIMNYLKPAGSSIVHPHLQLLVSDEKMDYQRRILENGAEYYEDTGRSYWQDLVDREEDGERYIGKTENFEWLSSFAPRGLEHVKGINQKAFTEFERGDLEGMGRGISQVLEAYDSMDYNSFNLSVFIPPLREENPEYATVIDMVTRSNLDKYYWSDVFSMCKLMDENYACKTPEKLAGIVKEYF